MSCKFSVHCDTLLNLINAFDYCPLIYSYTRLSLRRLGTTASASYLEAKWRSSPIVFWKILHTVARAGDAVVRLGAALPSLVVSSSLAAIRLSGRQKHVYSIFILLESWGKVQHFNVEGTVFFAQQSFN